MGDKKVIDARGRFGSRNANFDDSHQSSETHAASLRQTRARLDEADGIADKIRREARLGKKDRPLFVRNLGRMVEAVAPGDAVHGLINDLFQIAFGESANSALKKRKRYLRLSTEPLPEADAYGEYHATGVDFIKLARACATLKPTAGLEPNEQQQQAILKLVEDTSFDKRAHSVLRRSEGGRHEFIQRMGEVLAQISGAVNLDQYFDLACELPLTATVSPMPAQKDFYLQDDTKWCDLRIKSDRSNSSVVGPSGEDGDDLNEGTHFLAPKILIGFIYTPIEVDGVSYETAPEPDLSRYEAEVASLVVRYGPSHLDAFKRIVKQFRDELNAIPEPVWAEDSILDDSSYEARSAAELRMRQQLQAELNLAALPTAPEDIEVEMIKKAIISAHGPEASRMFDGSERERWELWSALADETETFWVVHSVFVSIYLERASGKPRLALTASEHERLEYDRFICRFPCEANDSEYRPYQLDDIDDFCIVKKQYAGGRMLIPNEFDLRCEARPEWAEKLHLLPSSASMNLMFAPLAKSLDSKTRAAFRPLFDDCAHCFSPAPHNTIAGAILRNFAHAPAGQRLDELLLADAREKSSAMQAMLDSGERSYRQGIARLTPTS